MIAPQVALILLLVAILAYLIIDCLTDRHEAFSQVRGGNNSYMMHEDLQNPELAAETMDKLNDVAMKLIAHLDSKYTKGKGLESIKPEYKKIVANGVKALKKNFKTANMQENIPERSGGDTSYVISKGDTFAMCLRDPKNGNAIDPKFNTLTFVLLHEMTHLFTKGYGHDTEFWQNFGFVIVEAKEAGLYTPVDYKRNGSPYCGITISYSPTYDPKLRNYFI